MIKAWQEVEPPQFLPRRYYAGAGAVGQTTVDVFWCGQCPFWANSRDELMHVANELGEHVEVHDINTDDRTVIEQ